MGLGDISAPLYLVGGGQDTQAFGGTVSAQNLNLAGAATALSAVTISANGKATVSFQASSNSLNVPLSLYGTVDGVNWVSIGGSPFLNQSTNLWQASIPAGTTGVFTAACGDFTAMRISAPNSATTGSAIVSAVSGTTAAIISSEPMRIPAVRTLASVQAKSSAGLLHTLIISPLSATPTAGLLTVYDSLTATGTVLYAEWVPAGVLPHTLTLDAAFLTGLFVGFDATLASVSVTVTIL